MYASIIGVIHRWPMHMTEAQLSDSEIQPPNIEMLFAEVMGQDMHERWLHEDSGQVTFVAITILLSCCFSVTCNILRNVLSREIDLIIYAQMFC